MKKYLSIITMLLLLCSGASAQNLLDRLGQRAKNAAENALSRKVEKSVEDAVDKATTFPKDKDGKEANEDSAQPDQSAKANQTSGWTCPACGHEGNNGKFCNECGAKKPVENTNSSTWTCQKCGHAGNTGNFCDECGAKKGERKIESSYSKCDFVPGDEIIFSDDFANEKLGEFPSKWDLVKGVSEVVKFDGRMTFDFQDVDTKVAPLMKDPHNYLTDEFTMELDFFAGDNSTIGPDLYSRSKYRMYFYSEEDGTVCDLAWHTADDKSISCYFTSQSGEGRNSEANLSALLKDGTWNHLALSFNKRAFKVYINGTRVINIPSMKAPRWFELESRLWSDHGVNYISDIRIAKGAVPLYDRLSTEGKIITYGITFEVGKATLKPEADVEINRIKGLMEQDASLKFEVQGHCDNTGSAAVNDKLSQQRAEAIVARLVELGISKDRLTAVGKGSSIPIADNSTDEGRAKNRRVEFIKK